MAQQQTTPTARRTSRLRRVAVWGGLVLSGLFILLIQVPASVGWRELDTFTTAEAGAFTVYLLLQIIAGIIAVTFLYPALRNRRMRWWLPVIFFGGASALGLPGAVACLVLVGTTQQTRAMVVAALAFLLGGSLDLLLSPEQNLDPPAVTLAVVVTALVLLVGHQVGARRRQRQLQFDGERAGERLRISRDIHDSLAHRLSLIAIHAGALDYRKELAPEQVRQAAGVIRQQAEHANDELHEILTALRTGTTELGPDFSIAEFVAAAREGGTDITTDGNLPVETELRERLSTLAWHAVQRTLQEAVGNARAHAPGQAVRLSFEETGSCFRMWVSNPVAEQSPPLPGRGLGLVGLHERAELAGGRLRVDRTGGFRIGIEVPWQKK